MTDNTKFLVRAVSMLTFNNTLILRESSSHFHPLKKARGPKRVLEESLELFHENKVL